MGIERTKRKTGKLTQQNMGSACSFVTFLGTFLKAKLLPPTVRSIDHPFPSLQTKSKQCALVVYEHSTVRFLLIYALSSFKQFYHPLKGVALLTEATEMHFKTQINSCTAHLFACDRKWLNKRNTFRTVQRSLHSCLMFLVDNAA